MTSRFARTVAASVATLVLTAAAVAAIGALPFQLAKKDVPGIRNFTQVEPTVACGGATTVAAIAELKQAGFRAIINLRLSSEPGADVEASAQAATEAGLNYIHIPFNHKAPDPAAVDAFLAVVSRPENQPVFIHCGSGERAATLWMIKRVVQDGWSVDDAMKEAEGIGLEIESLKTFALQYIKDHKR
jgi:uncharacterized protein (TIGR01244 family)